MLQTLSSLLALFLSFAAEYAFSPNLPENGGFRSVKSVQLAQVTVKFRTRGSSSPDYFGQPRPGRTPELFAPGIVSTPAHTETSPIFSKDGHEAYWTQARIGERAAIMTSRFDGGRWSSPAPIWFTKAGVFDSKPALSADGRFLLFASTRPIDGRPDLNKVTRPVSAAGGSCLNLWYAERTPTGWSEPRPFGAGVNTAQDEDVPLASADGAMYFVRSAPGGYRLYRYDLRLAPEGSADEVQSAVKGLITYFAPDGSYLLYQGDRGGSAQRGVGISFRNADGSWSPGVALSEELDAFGGFGAVVSPDQKYLFLMSDRTGNGDVYWLTADVIGEAKHGGRQNRNHPGAPRTEAAVAEVRALPFHHRIHSGPSRRSRTARPSSPSSQLLPFWRKPDRMRASTQ